MKKLSPDEIKKIEQELKNSSLDEATQSILKGIITGQIFLLDLVERLIQASGFRRAKLIKELAKILEIDLKKRASHSKGKSSGKKDTSSKKEGKDSDNETSPPKKSDEKPSGEDQAKHPKRKNDEYKPIASHIYFHQDLEPGDQCPTCLFGRVYPFREKIIPILVGRSPLAFEEHRLQILRCNACGDIFEPNFPEQIPKQGLSQPSAQAILTILHYKTGVPFASLSYLQKIFRQEVSPAQLWGVIKQTSIVIEPIYYALKKYAASANLFYSDDTKARILSHYQENQKNREKKGRRKLPKDRVGTYSSLIIGCTECNHEVYLFFHGRKYAGENLTDLLAKRSLALERPIQMKDASTMNIPSGVEIIEAKCNAHAFRKFKDLIDLYPKQSQKIVEKYRQVNKNDQMLLQENRSDNERLIYHKKHSLPLMEEIRSYAKSLLDSRQVEPNSSFGGAIAYFLSHYEGLTAFCTVEGAPFDNNKSERALKMIIRLRKTSMFYKTEQGAEIGGMLQSILYTAQEAGVNTLDYLNFILSNEEKVVLNPEAYFPWNYEQTRSELRKDHSSDLDPIDTRTASVT